MFESLAWASAQVHCQCSTNSKLVLTERLNATTRLAAINASMFLKCETKHIPSVYEF